jgi:hypothetical protein
MLQPSPLTKISSRDLRKEMEHKKRRWTIHWSWRSENIRIVEKRIFAVSPIAFPSVRGWQSPLQSLVMLHSSLDPLNLTTLSNTLGGEKLSQVLMLRLTPSIGVRTFKLKRPLAQSEVTFSWIAEQDGYTKSREIKTTRLGVNQHQAGHWIDLVNTKALLERNGHRKALANPQRCGSKVGANQGVHLDGSEWYASAI